VTLANFAGFTISSVVNDSFVVASAAGGATGTGSALGGSTETGGGKGAGGSFSLWSLDIFVNAFPSLPDLLLEQPIADDENALGAYIGSGRKCFSCAS